METIRLGNTEHLISRVGMGGCPLGGYGWGPTNDDELQAAVRHAMDGGVNFFDTADVYGLGHSEELLSRALGERRREVVIASKFGVRWDGEGRIWKDISPKYLREALENSLRRLRIDCIPLYYVHWPDGVTPITDAVAELDRCRAEGKIRWIGLSNFPLADVQAARAVAPIQALQYRMNLLEYEDVLPLAEYARSAGMTLATWGSLAHGLLTGTIDSRSTFAEGDRRNRYEHFQKDRLRENLRVVDKLAAAAARLGKTPAQTAIRWLLDTPGVSCVLFGATKPLQVEENLGAVEWKIPPDEHRLLGSSKTA
jgi:myo-inositol catabolism protein IolS